MAIDDFSFVLELDTAKDGSWATDVSTYLYQASIRRGRADALSADTPGQMTVTLDNRDGRFSPLKGTIAALDHDLPIRLYRVWTTPAITNLITNPAFTVDVARWLSQNGPSIARDTAESFTSSAAMKVGAVNSINAGAVFGDAGGSGHAVTVGQRYTFRVRVNAPLGKRMEIALQWINGGIFQTDRKTFVGTGEWQDVDISIVAPATAVTMGPTVWTEIADGVFDFFIDAAFSYDSTGLSEPLQPYVDGRQPGCTWSGTVDDSTSSRSANPIFLLFQGRIFDFDLSWDGADRTARLICADELARIGEQEIDLGIMRQTKSGLLINRVLDRAEGEESAVEWSAEFSGGGGHPAGTSWSGVGGVAGFAFSLTGASADLDDAFENSWVGTAVLTSSAIDSGIRFKLTGVKMDPAITADTDYVLVVYGRTLTGTLAVKLRYLRDSTEVAQQAATLTTAWQRIELRFNTGAIGTNQYAEVVTTEISSNDFSLDDWHIVHATKAIERGGIDAGDATLAYLAAFDEPVAPVLMDVVNSEPGRLFARAGALSDGGEIVFHALSKRPAAGSPPGLILGDGDGLFGFAFSGGLSFAFDSTDRIQQVKVTSRGTPVQGGAPAGVWQLQPERNVASGEKWIARYSQPSMNTIASAKDGSAVIKTLDVDFGIGMRVNVVTGDNPFGLSIEGVLLDWPSEESLIIKEDLTLDFHRTLTVAMPLQGDATSDMDTEAQRLLDKYSRKVFRGSVKLTQQEGDSGDVDLLRAFQVGFDLDDPIVIRATFAAHSPNVDKLCWIEGIEHRIGRDGVMETVFNVEEAG